jgi:hypothetical protein
MSEKEEKEEVFNTSQKKGVKLNHILGCGKMINDHILVWVRRDG